MAILIYFCYTINITHEIEQNYSSSVFTDDIVGSVCRILGFAPQIAMAVFGAVVIKR